ncbi:fimbria/pilus outer membrane usher protein [Escherichia coli]
MGYNGRIGKVSYSIASTKLMNQSDRSRSLHLVLTRPGRATIASRPTQDGPTNQQVGVSGTLLEDRNLSYSVQEGYASNGCWNSGNANVGYQAGPATST